LTYAPERADLEEIGQVDRGAKGVAAIELSSRWEARMTFPNPPVATVRVARITQRDRGTAGKSWRLSKETLLPVVDLSPLVMAIWSEWTIWDIRGRLRKSREQEEK
jgi:hypothetical protein